MNHKEWAVIQLSNLLERIMDDEVDVEEFSSQTSREIIHDVGGDGKITEIPGNTTQEIRIVYK